jgi:hypothetical protein
MFSCFARSLKKIPARSMEELVTSIQRSFDSVKVWWVRSVVDYWSTVSGRWLKTSLKGSFSFEMVLYNGRAVMRTKDSMSGDTWLPMGGVKFARPLLREPEREVLAAKAALCYVVPGVLPTASLRKSIDDLKPRLMTQRAIITYPNETTGAAYKWWCDFIAEEEARQERMCASCKSIREELTTIVVHQAKIKVNETRVLNKQKLSRREEHCVCVCRCVYSNKGLVEWKGQVRSK